MATSGAYIENPQDAAAEEDADNDLSTVIDRLGFGCAQISQITMSAGMWAGDAAEVLILSCLTKAMSDEWHMTPMQQSSIVSVVLLGLLIGNLLAGQLGDHFGRKLPILISMAGLATFNLLTLCATNFWSLLPIRVLMGISIGIGQPPQVALSTEISPSHCRGESIGFTQLFFGLGELYSAALIWYDDPSMTQLDWRSLVKMITIPSVIFFFTCCFFLHESPRILALQGRDEEARSVLEHMRAYNGRPEVKLDYDSIQSERCQNNIWERWWASLKMIFGPELFLTTCGCCFTLFSINLLYYGIFYAFPLLLPDMPLHNTPAMSLVVTTVWEIIGYSISIPMAKFLSRRTTVMIFTCGQIISMSVFLFAFGRAERASLMEISADDTTKMLLQGSMNGIKLFTAGVFVLCFLWYSELYPTIVRSTGFGMCMMVGRIGAIVSPLLFEYTRQVASTQVFFYGVMIATVINLLVLPFLQETKDLQLLDDFKGVESGEQRPIVVGRETSR